MFGFSSSVETKGSSTPPAGVAEIVFCVFDEQHRLHHYFRSGRDAEPGTECFRFLNHPDHAFEHCFLREAVSSQKPVSVSLSFGAGFRKYLYVLPYERKWSKWRFACVQVTLEPITPDSMASPSVCALTEERICLLLADSENTIRAVSSNVPEAFGYIADNLTGMNLYDLFSKVDLGIIDACSPDTNESILSCVFLCLDGSRRDVDIKKYSAPDQCTLYAVCDVASRQSVEEISQVGSRERRRIGQDLHDSIGQLLTGISLLSRSLANSLRRGGHSGEADAAQISALADDASNQIRQISRGLMPSEIVQKGLFDSLRELAHTITSSCGVLCMARIDDTVEFSDSAVETHLYRIAQEAVNNAVRHAGASRIDVIISQQNGMPRLEVADNGTWKGTTENMNGIGMKTMEYRASAIGGRLKAGADAQGGSRVVCLLDADDSMATKA